MAVLLAMVAKLASVAPLVAALLVAVFMWINEMNVVGPMSVTVSILLKAVCISASIVRVLGRAMETVQEPRNIWSTFGDTVVWASDSRQ